MSEPLTIGGCTLLHGDMLTVLPTLDAESFHSCVCDPPYHLTSIVKRFGATDAAPAKVGKTGAYARASAGFMGKQWDGGDVAFRPETWAEVLRVMKPGAHLVAFSGTRTYHRMACAIEDAGFEIRDQLAWAYGSGFPKSHNIGKAIDRAGRRDFVTAAVEMGVPLPARSIDDWTKEGHAPGDKWWCEFKAGLPPETWAAIERRTIGRSKTGDSGWFVSGEGAITAPATDAAREWDGWGTALKPAWEPIVLARKPLSEGSNAANVLKHGTGALNIDGCRVHAPDAQGGSYTVKRLKPGATLNATGGNWRPEEDGVEYQGEMKAGRWPANLCHDGSDEVLEAFGRSGARRSEGTVGPARKGIGYMGGASGRVRDAAYADTGTAARFFFSAKADADDRAGSKHPTVKPVDLMRWLVRLVTPEGGRTLDCFAGSGTTGEAALLEGCRAVLIEREAEYAADIRRRLGRLSGADTPLFTEAAKTSVAA